MSGESDCKSLCDLVMDLQASADEVSSLAKESVISTDFSLIIDKLPPVLMDIKKNKLMDTPPILKALEALETELRRAKALITSPKGESLHVKQIQQVTQNLGRSLGLVLFAGHDILVDGKDNIRSLQKEMMNARFSSDAISSYDSKSEEIVEEFGTEEDSENEIVQETESCVSIEDVVMQVKYGDDDEFRYAILGLYSLISDNKVSDEWINDEGIIPVLFNRLGSSKPYNRLTIIRILRTLVAYNDHNKEKMVDIAYLSTLVKSLTRDLEEQKEAVGLLSTLSDVSAVRRRIGRIQGCIVMLVAIFNGDDQVASRDAGKLLNTLSNNTQNALHMAEAGYFKPLVQYLKEGSDMSKILMATALSRMELRDQTRASIGENGAIEPLVKMFKEGKLEAKLSALSALQNLSSLKENTSRLITSGIVASLLQLLFSVTSVLMTLREPASAILARIAKSESVLVNKDIALQMLSLLNLCSPAIQYHLLKALNSISGHPSASKVRRKMKENGAFQLLLPFLVESSTKIRTAALKFMYTLSKDSAEELSEQVGETHLSTIINIISSSKSEKEKCAAIGIISNLPASEKKATDTLKRANLLPVLIAIVDSSQGILTNAMSRLFESISAILIRFTISSDKKLQLFSAENGIIPVLVKLLSTGSSLTKCNAATALAQLSQNSVSLRKLRKPSWLCGTSAGAAFCEVHNGNCFVKTTFCLIKAEAIRPLIHILEGKEREADEAVLGALSTLLQDEILESGSNYIARQSGVQAIIKVLEFGTVKAQQKGLWMLDRIFRTEVHRMEYGNSAQVVLIELAQKGDLKLKPTVAKLLAQLELLQPQSSYF
ncbi:hypothetical protein ACET3Z_031316 [Daucus carota]